MISALLHIFSVALIIAVVTGCDRKDDAQATPAQQQAGAAPAAAKQPTLNDDPAVSFETYSGNFVKQARQVIQQQTQSSPDRHLVWPDKENFSINVQKTDSLMSPYVGTISSKLSVVERVKEEGARKLLKDQLIDGCMWTEVDCTLAFAAQKGKWVLTSVKALDPRHPSADAAQFVRPTMEQTAASTPQ